MLQDDIYINIYERKNIIIVGIDKAFLNSTKKYIFERIHCKVTVTDSVKSINSRDFDLVLVDLKRSSRGSVYLVNVLRSKVGYKTKILVLTPESCIDDKIKLLTSGADDYLWKPFDFRELECRIKKLLNIYLSYDNFKNDVIKIGENIYLDISNSVLHIDSIKVKLTFSELQLLKYLGGRKYSPQKMILISELSKDMAKKELTENYFNVLLHRLRKKIYSQTGRKLIRTTYNGGYEIIR